MSTIEQPDADIIAAARALGIEVERHRLAMIDASGERRAALRELRRRGMSIRRIASEIGCSPAVVQQSTR